MISCLVWLVVVLFWRVNLHEKILTWKETVRKKRKAAPNHFETAFPDRYF
jgi:hypothetical protein